MFCKNCGQEINDNADVCLNCGVAVKHEQAPVKKTNTVAIVGFIFAFIFPLVGFICSIIGIKRSNDYGSGKGLAIAGLIISIIMWIVNSIYTYVIVMEILSYYVV